MEYFLPNDQFIHKSGMLDLKERQYKISGTKWEIHQNDVDDWPSIPHAHNKENNSEVINLYTGEVFNRNVNNYRESKPIYKLSNKQMKYFYNLITQPDDEIAKQLLNNKDKCIYL